MAEAFKESMTDLSAELAFAREAAVKACFLAETLREKFQSQSITKSDKSPVTIADYAVQALTGGLLEHHFPGDVLVGEENAELLKSQHAELLPEIEKHLSIFFGLVSTEDVLRWVGAGKLIAGKRAWILDPIDGTKGFIRGGQYAVSLGLLENNQVTVGVLGCPRLTDKIFTKPGILAWAVRGQGAFYAALDHLQQPRPLKVSETARLSSAVMIRSEDESHSNFPKIQKLRDAAGNTAKPLEMSSLAKIVMLAAGNADFLLRLLSEKKPDYREWIWDQAAGVLILEEAGGKTTDSHGKELDFSQGLRLEKNVGILASNGKVHAEILALLNKVSA